MVIGREGFTVMLMKFKLDFSFFKRYIPTVIILQGPQLHVICPTDWQAPLQSVHIVVLFQKFAKLDILTTVGCLLYKECEEVHL
jgi:hypothetical protein